MNESQKFICRELLRLSYAHGFDSAYPLVPIAEAGGITDLLYDPMAETGLLWDLAERKGLLWMSNDGEAAGVSIESRDLLENWSR